MNDDQLYPIGDVARRTGLSVSAIRYYADQGVIAATSHTDAGYRLYDIDAIARLELVRTLRELGAGLDDIRRLLAGGTTLRDLATTHLELVDRQVRHLRARRAVLRTLVKQHTATEQVTLMHNLVSMSDDERNRLLDRFWDEVTDGLDVHPAFTEQLHRMRPALPADPTTEQLQAWIELADLLQDDTFRRSVAQFLRDSFSSPEAMARTAPPRLERMEKVNQAIQEAEEAERSGLSPDSPRARAIAERYLASFAELAADHTGAPLDQHDLAELRRSMIAPDATSAGHQVGERGASDFTDVFGPFLSLMATIDGTPRPDPQGPAAGEQWIAAALAAPGSHRGAAPDR